jgi:hypothetical protein
MVEKFEPNLNAKSRVAEVPSKYVVRTSSGYFRDPVQLAAALATSHAAIVSGKFIWTGLNNVPRQSICGSLFPACRVPWTRLEASLCIHVFGRAPSRIHPVRMASPAI